MIFIKLHSFASQRSIQKVLKKANRNQLNDLGGVNVHPVFLGIILFSLLVSSLMCLWIIKTKANKWTRILVAFSLNALILSIASAYLYKLDVQTFHKQTEGLFDSLGIGTLVFFVPINAFVNILVMEFLKNKRDRVDNKRPI